MNYNIYWQMHKLNVYRSSIVIREEKLMDKALETDFSKEKHTNGQQKMHCIKWKWLQRGSSHRDATQSLVCCIVAAAAMLCPTDISSMNL